MNFDIISNSFNNGGKERNKAGGRTKVIKQKRLNDLEKAALGLEVDILLNENINF